MTDKKLIENIVNEFLAGKDIFLVNVKVSKSNVITVTIDGDNGVVVDNCIEISRYIESRLDRDKEDFELTVTSFGLEEYFTLPRQYAKNKGENVEVILQDGSKEYGILSSFEDNKITLSDKKQKNSAVFDLNDVQKTRVLINF